MSNMLFKEIFLHMVTRLTQAPYNQVLKNLKNVLKKEPDLLHDRICSGRNNANLYMPT